MKNNPLFLVLCCGLLAVSCTGNRTAEPAAVPPVRDALAYDAADNVPAEEPLFAPSNASGAISSASSAAQSTQTDAPLPAAQAEPAGNKPAAAKKSKKEAAPEEVTIFLQDVGTNLDAQPDTAAETQRAEDLIKQARAAQTLPAPQADQASFEDEDLIPLEGRRLSPMAYEPAVKAASAVPWSGEELKYGVYYSFIKAGTAYIKNRGLTTVNGRKAYLIQTTAFSAAVIDAFFKVRDVNYSWIDAENFYSLGYTQSVREGSYKRDEWLIFDYPRSLFYGEIQKKEDPRVISGPLSMQVLDMLSSLYYVRAQKLEIGQDIVFDIINRERQYPLVVKVLGKETVKTSAGKFNCIVVEPQFRGEGIFVSKGKSLKVWLTDDEYKMPVKMKTEVFIGSVSAELLEYKRN